MSRRYLETMSDDALIRMIDETRRSVNDIMATPIIDGASGSGYNRVNIGDVLDPPGRYLRYAIRYTEEIVIKYEIEISRRIAYDAMNILSQRRKKIDNE